MVIDAGYSYGICWDQLFHAMGHSDKKRLKHFRRLKAFSFSIKEATSLCEASVL